MGRLHVTCDVPNDEFLEAERKTLGYLRNVGTYRRNTTKTLPLFEERTVEYGFGSGSITYVAARAMTKRHVSRIDVVVEGEEQRFAEFRRGLEEAIHPYLFLREGDEEKLERIL